MKSKVVTIVFAAVFVCGCASGHTDRLGMALDMAGKEREAVELFLDGYEAGSLERRAAEYIV